MLPEVRYAAELDACGSAVGGRQPLDFFRSAPSDGRARR